VQRFEAGSLRQFGQALLCAAGLAQHRAAIVTEVLLEGDLLGHTTHGFALLPSYLSALQQNTMEKQGEPKVVADHGSAFTWEGRYLPGPWLVHQAIQTARERLAQHPVVTVVIRRSHHIGCLQAYLKPVTDDGLMILLQCSDPANFVVAPFGGTEPQFSPNPIAVGIPTDADPILIDISTSTTAFGLCRRAAAAGEVLPGEWLLDTSGKSTNDPHVLDPDRGGSILPLGGPDLGYKGFALALMVEAMTNGLGGWGRADGEARWGASIFLQLIDPKRFSGDDAFIRETSHLVRSCHGSPAPEGKPPVRLPGHAALARRNKQLVQGVELHPSIMPALTPWAEQLKVAIPPAP